MSEESHRLRLQPRLKLEAPPPPPPIEFEPPVQNPEDNPPAFESPPEEPPAFVEISEPAVENVETVAPDPDAPVAAVDEPVQEVEAPAEEQAAAPASDENFPAFDLPLEAPPFPEASQPPIELPETTAPVEEETPRKPKMTLRRRNDEPAGELTPPPPPLPISRPAPPTSLPLAATRVLSAPPMAGNLAASPAGMAEKNRKLSMTALALGAVGLLVFAIAGYVAYQNLGSNANAHSTDSTSSTRDSKPFWNRRSTTTSKPAPDEKSAAKEPVEEPAGSNTVTVSQSVPNEPSPAFQTWVHALKINGVRAGTPPRIIVAGKLYTPGETINVELGIMFDSYDAANHILRFKDKQGYVLERADR